MDTSHGAAAAGGGAFGAALAGVLASTFHWDVNLASNWVIIITSVATGVGALVVWWIKWKYPAAPPLPGELVEVPTGTPAVQVARVTAPVSTPTSAVTLPPAPPSVIIPSVPAGTGALNPPSAPTTGPFS